LTLDICLVYLDRMIPALRLVRTLPLPGAEPVPELPPGLLVEFSGDRETARLSSATSLLVRAQAQGETVAWIEPAGGSLYPPDLAEGGVDLDTLIVVRVPVAAGNIGLARATEMLVRSGAFGFVVVDVRDGGPRSALPTPVSRSSSVWRLPPAWQGRLLSAAREHGSRVVFLSSRPAGMESVGALVGLRLEPRRVRFAPGRFAIEHHVLKNKPGLPYADAFEPRRGPWGLR
jgi:hypothetical protein